jgi:uncharacterized protein YndB with AHSA1/START domain
MRFIKVMLAIAVTACAAKAGDVADCSTTDATGGRIVCHATVIDAPPSDVWAAMVDPATIMRWSVPFASVDLRQGGSMEQGFAKNAKAGDPDNIRHDIIGFMPERVIVFRNTNSPAMLPGRERYKNVLQIVEFDPVASGQTRITVIQTGYGSGPEWDGLHQFFATHNPEYLQMLKAALETGVLHKPGGAS